MIAEYAIIVACYAGRIVSGLAGSVGGCSLLGTELDSLSGCWGTAGISVQDTET